MIQKHLSVAFMGLIISALLIFSPAYGNSAEKNINLILQKSGAERQLAQIPNMMASQLQQQKEKLGDKKFGKISSALLEAFNKKDILAITRKVMKEKYNEAGAKAVLEWYQSSLAKKLTSLEVASSTPGGFKKMIAYAQGLQKTPPPKERVALLLKMDKVGRISEQTTQIVALSMRAMMEGLSPMQPKGKRLTAKDIERNVVQVVKQLGPRMQQQTLVSFLYTYQGVKNSDIQKYTEFLNNPGGKWFADVYFSAKEAFFLAASKNFAKKVTKMKSDKQI